MAQSVLFGRYRLLSRAGAGGSAQVWRAVDERTGEEVAVKRLHPVVFADPAARRRLQRESAALRGLESPHIVRVRDSQVTDDEAAIVLDYVAGETLAGRIAEQGRLSVPETLSVVHDVGAALTTAHAAGIVHRDVKPANIIVAEDGRAMLTDFGVAQQDAANQAGTATRVTTPGMVVGSLRYMAPEQLRGEPATAASDQYGLAAVAYEMLSGRPPYAAGTPVALAAAHAAPVAPLTDIDAELAAAVERGLATDPADRFSDVATFAAAVGGAISSGTATAKTITVLAVDPGTASVPLATHPQRNRLAIAAGALAIVFSAIIALAALEPGSPSGAPTEQPAVPITTTPPSEASSAPPDATPAAQNDRGNDNRGKGNNNGKNKGKGKGNDGGGNGD
jgi:serine/threonine-protein kinase